MAASIIKWNSLSEKEKDRFLRRSEEDIGLAAAAVKPILEDVRADGDAAVARYTAKYDWPGATAENLWVGPEEFDAAIKNLSPELIESLNYAIENVAAFHAHQKPAPMPLVEVRPGLWAGERWTALDRVALYVPRGKGSFPSMLYMLAVPARIAGVGELLLCTPPDKDGSVDAACLYAARKCGVTRILKAGGAQAVAAFAYGTQTVPKVDKLLGPGSSYVAAAKRLVSDLIDTGLPAGPSESIVLADPAADPRLVALDILIEAEHGPDSAAFLVTWDAALAAKVKEELDGLAPQIPGQRRDFVNAVFEKYGGVVLVRDEEDAYRFVNEYAPEHLMLHLGDPWDKLGKIKHAGEVLLGPWTPFSAANYLTGPNAVLPTGGKARTSSPVSVRDFMHSSSVVSASAESFAGLAGHVLRLADYEGFFTHAQAIRERLPGKS